jgi:hypothetical protein
MAATQSDAMVVSRAPAFQDRVRYAVVKAASAIMAEAAGTASHAQRVAYAKLVLAGMVDIFSLSVGVTSNPTVFAELNPAATPNYGVPDADLEFTVNSLFNAYAGVSL